MPKPGEVEAAKKAAEATPMPPWLKHKPTSMPHWLELKPKRMPPGLEPKPKCTPRTAVSAKLKPKAGDGTCGCTCATDTGLIDLPSRGSECAGAGERLVPHRAQLQSSGGMYPVTRLHQPCR